MRIIYSENVGIGDFFLQIIYNSLMGRKKKQTIEFRFYEIPQGHSCLALLGDKWIRVYGEGENTLHFHNLFEVGYCRYGDGDMVFDERDYHYETDMFSAIPPNYPHTTLSEDENFWEYFFFDPEAIVTGLYPDNVPKQREALAIINKRADLMNASEHRDMAEIIKRIMEEMRDKNSYYKETTQNLINTFVLMLMRMHKSMDAEAPTLTEMETGGDIVSIKPAINYIEEHYADDIRAQELANVCNMSETHFRRSIPLFTMMSKLKLLNTVWGFALPAISTPFMIMMFRQNSRNFPPDIMEAARIDGLSELAIFFRMYMPVMKSTYAAAAVITFMNAWNAYLWPRVVMTDNRAQTMPMLIANLAGGYTIDYGMLMMGVLFCSLPTMIVFFVLQKQFTEGITGSVK